MNVLDLLEYSKKQKDHIEIDLVPMGQLTALRAFVGTQHLLTMKLIENKEHNIILHTRKTTFLSMPHDNTLCRVSQNSRQICSYVLWMLKNKFLSFQN